MASADVAVAASKLPGSGKGRPKTPPTEATPQAELFANRIKVYPRVVTGYWRQVKWAVVVALLGLYYAAPWIRWDRGANAPDQALLVDIGGRRAYFFGLEIWPQEVYYLTGLLILGAIGLFLVTVVLTLLLADQPLGQAAVARQPKCSNIKARSQFHLDATISTGGAAKWVSVPPTEMLTKSRPSVP